MRIRRYDDAGAAAIEVFVHLCYDIETHPSIITAAAHYKSKAKNGMME